MKIQAALFFNLRFVYIDACGRFFIGDEKKKFEIQRFVKDEGEGNSRREYFSFQQKIFFVQGLQNKSSVPKLRRLMRRVSSRQCRA